jgi:hypothetical protein
MIYLASMIFFRRKEYRFDGNLESFGISIITDGEQIMQFLFDLPIPPDQR